ncbi:hypothetical protein FBUS_03148 [Fasciolopsis buskii]|uniref:Uncharacterized protein n=1 Tax=Fasciolopsis buskii TaxID=27845 RepID=A0A8E0RWQ7_9TREM|nr:hypothetical protein FBUS_03148 [Fasciolopsis buski]
MPVPVIYDLHGKKRTTALCHSAVISRQIRLQSAFTSISSCTRRNSYQLVSPWELEFQRHLIEGSRLRKPNRYNRRSRSVQSSDERLLRKLVVQSLASVSPEPQESLCPNTDTPEWSRSHRYSDLRDIELLNTTDSPSENPSSDHIRMNDSRRQSMTAYENSGEKVLQYNFPEIARKVSDNEGMGIDTFSYLETQPEPPKDDSGSTSIASVSSEDESPISEWVDSSRNRQQESIGLSDDESLENKAKLRVSLPLE